MARAMAKGAFSRRCFMLLVLTLMAYALISTLAPLARRMFTSPTLAEEPECYTAVWRERARKTPLYSGAFVYLVYLVENEYVAQGNIRRSIKSLQDYVFPVGPFASASDAFIPYSIVIFTDEIARYVDLMHEFPRFYFEFIVVDPLDWAVNLPEGKTAVQTWRSDYSEKSTAPSWGLMYRQMGKYAGGYLLSHPQLARYEYVVKLDPDTYATGPWRKDPFWEMRKHDRKIGYWVGDFWNYVDYIKNMPEQLLSYIKENNITMTHPEWTFTDLNDPTTFRNPYFYGCFIGAKTATFRSAEYQSFFKHMNAIGGFVLHKWDEQVFYPMFASIYLNRSQDIEYFDYVSIIHQGSTFRRMPP